MSLRLKLAIMFLGVAIIPLLFVNAMIFHNYKDSIEASRISALQDITVYKSDKIEEFFADMRNFMAIAQGAYAIKQNLPVLSRAPYNLEDPQFIAVRKTIDPQLQNMQSIMGLVDIMLVSPDGKIVYSSNLEHKFKEFGKSLSDASSETFEMGSGKIHFSGIFLNRMNHYRPGMLITGPVQDSNGKFIGVIAFEADLELIYKMILDKIGLGETGESLLVKKEGGNVVYLNPLRFDSDATFKKKIPIGAKLAIPAQEAAQGRNGAGITLDYRGEKVIAAWRNIPSMGWGLVAKIDSREAFADVSNLERLAVIILLIVSSLAGIMAYSVAKSISNPIQKLSEGVKMIGAGNLDFRVGTKLKDEIGQLSRAFDKMTGDLKAATASRDFERKRFHEILDALPAYVILLDKDYKVPFANHYFESRFGKSNDRCCFDYLFKRSEPCENCETFKALKTNKPHRWEWLGPDGRNYDIYDFPFTDTDGSTMILEMGIDITEMKTAKAELQKHRDNLEELVKQRTSQLETANEDIRKKVDDLRVVNEELSRFNKAMVDRELRMVELKRQINELCMKSGMPARYRFEEDKRGV
ncbi:MAG TPA: hypothetical protein DCZ94_01150 [Lentisphaeria bacterium]|nr:MAG: hypothetical protein A2X48_11625 [Lentisphaerae bacterium GWF2_49_21]HBC85538.1 hypothetical protein [Lentisphaeria bacterium]